MTDRAQLVDWIKTHSPDADLTSCLAETARLSNRLESGSADEVRAILHAVVAAVALQPSAIVLSVKASHLVAMLGAGLATESTSTNDDDEHQNPNTSIELPVTVKRRGDEMRLIIQGDNHGRSPNPQLVNLVARAHLYLQHLTRAPDITVRDVARHFGVHRVDVGRILPLAFLAPRILDQILTGKQPDTISPRSLARGALPLLWADQSSAIG